jgi:maleylacetate reductase
VSGSFVHEALPGRVCFGAGEAESLLVGELDRLGLQRIMLVGSPRHRALAERLTGARRSSVVDVFTEVRQHVPRQVVKLVRARAAAAGVDGVVCVGGGSATGTAKALALDTGLPVVAVPLTLAGSEMTPVWGMTADGRKVTGRSPRVLPKSVVYDPELLLDLPDHLLVSSSLNAMAHCVEALWAAGATPATDALALAGVRHLRQGLHLLPAADRLEVCDALLRGAYLAGSGFAVAGAGLHHKICHVLGGAFDLPHAETHAVVLPAVLELNAPTLAEEPRRMLASALDADDPLAGLRDLYRRVGAPTALRSLGVRPADVEEAVALLAESLPIPNPVPLDRNLLTAVLRRAWQGASAEPG